MARFMVCINNNERLDNGDEDNLMGVRDEVEELLRDGYFEVEYVVELGDDEE